MKRTIYSFILIMFSMIAFAADSQLSAYNDIFSRRNAAIEAANKTALNALLPLTKTAKGETLTMIWQGIKEIDPQNEAATKYLAEKPTQDLLGLTDPKSTINAAKAQLLAKMVKSGKYTQKDWEAMPGDAVYSCGAGWKQDKLPVVPGHVYILVPNPEDIWKYSESSPPANYMGGGGGKVALCWINAKDPKAVSIAIKDQCIFKVAAEEKDPSYKLSYSGGGAGLNSTVGTLRVKMYEVVP